MPKKTDCDIAIIGAGVAGLAAASELAAAKKQAVCLEATDSIGGRVFTVHDPLAPLPIELGAEFVHGLPPETWGLIRQANLTAYEHTAKAVHILNGGILMDKDVGEFADRVVSGPVELRELFVDAPELGKKALENVLREILTDVAQTPPPPVESAGRVGSRLDKVS